MLIACETFTKEWLDWLLAFPSDCPGGGGINRSFLPPAHALFRVFLESNM